MKSNKVTRVLSVVLAALMVLSLATISAAAEGDKISITWMGYSNGYVPFENTPVEQFIEERFGVELTAAPVDISNADDINLYFASGNTADYILGGNTTKLAEQGLIQELDWDEILEYMPDWMNMVAAMTGGMDNLKKLVTMDGVNWYIPWSRFDYASTEGMNIRKDWLDALGLDVPETLEDLHEVFRAFTFDDPDGNGEDDTYGYSFTAYLSGIMDGAFLGQVRNSYYVDDGVVKFSSIEEGYKESLKYYHDLYAEGVIDPEWISDDRTAMWDKWGQGKLGCMTLDPWMVNNNAPTRQLFDNATDYSNNLVYLPSLKDGDGNWLGARGYIPLDLAGKIGYATDDETRHMIMTILNTVVTDPEFGYSLQYGIKGTDWDFDENGIIKQIVTDKDQLNAEGAYLFGLVPAGKDLLPMMISNPYVLDAFDAAFSVPFWVNGTAYDLYSITNTTRNELGADVNTICSDYYNKAITGEVDIDETWDAYVADVKAAGVDAIIEEYQSKLN